MAPSRFIALAEGVSAEVTAPSCSVPSMNSLTLERNYAMHYFIST